MKAFALQNLNMSMMEVENVVNIHMRMMRNLIFWNSIVDSVKTMPQRIVPLIKDAMIVSVPYPNENNINVMLFSFG